MYSVVAHHARESALTAVSLPTLTPGSIYIDGEHEHLHLLSEHHSSLAVYDEITVDGYTGMFVLYCDWS